MGAWGPAIFSDDLAADVRDDFRDLIGDGLSPAAATAKLLADYGPNIADDPDEGPVFWLALAATQWSLGRLEESVKNEALRVIESGVNLKKWEMETGPAEVKRRANALAKLRTQLLSPMPPTKNVKKRYIQETEFEVGEVWRYRLVSSRRALLLVVKHHSDKGGRLAIVTILDVNENVPIDLDHLIQVSVLRPKKPWSRSRFAIARWSKTDYPQARLERVLSGMPVPRQTSEQDKSWSITWWKRLDAFLLEEFGLE